MTSALGQERARRAGWLMLIAAAFVSVAAVSVSIESRTRDANRTVGLALPQFASGQNQATSIKIVSKDVTYTIEDTPKGWALKDRGGYPVRREKLAQFVDGLSSLALLRPMTRDPQKHERLGLGDPTKGGSGILVQIAGPGGGILAELILGVQPGGQLFVRKPNQDQTWAARGKLPALRDPSQWLNLTPFTIARERIARVDIVPALGPAFAVARAVDGQSFSLQPPFSNLEVIAPTALSQTVNALTQLNPIDVQQAGAISGAPVARVTAQTFDGVRMEGELYEVQGKRWLKLIVRATMPDKEEEAATLNQAAAPWAFGLSELDFRDIAPSLSTLVRTDDGKGPT
jgi:hypothetical protein